MGNMKDQSDKDRRLAHIGRLSAGIGHNIMTPLSLIMMNSDLLSMKLKGKDELLSHLKEITQQVTQISRIAEIMMWKVKTEEQDTPSTIQVGLLVQENIEFWMGDMFFKHRLEKDIQINTQTPLLKGVPYHFTSFIDEWILLTLERARPLNGGKFILKVDSPETNHFFISFKDSLPPLSKAQFNALAKGCVHPSCAEYFPALHRLLTYHPADLKLSTTNDGSMTLRLTWAI